MFANYNISNADLQAIMAMTQIERDELISKINGYNPANFLELIPGKSNEYYCPCCGNGTGETASGIIPTYENGKYIYGCRKGGGSCNFNGDLIAIIGKCNNLAWRGAGLFEILAIGAQIIGNSFSSTAKAKPARDNSQAIDAARKVISKAQANIDNLPQEYRRGLTLETLKHFGCGYVSDYQPKTTAPKYPALIIPAGNSFVAVAVEREKLDSSYFKRFAYNLTPQSFNLNSINSSGVNLVVEGAIDAMSIWQATGGKYSVVATHSADGYKRFIKECKAKSIAAKFIILFDSDKEGRKAADIFAKVLNQVKGCVAVTKFLFNEVSKLDANDILVNEGFRNLLGKIDTLVEQATVELNEVVPARSARQIVRDKNQIPIDKLTTEKIPSCPLELKIPPAFEFNESGIYKWVTTSKLKTASYVAAIPTAVYQGESSITELSVYDKITDTWQRYNVETEILADTGELESLVKLGIDLDPLNKKYFAEFIMAMKHFGDNQQKIPHYYLYEKTGWHNKHFVYPNRNKNELIYGNGLDYKNAVEEKGDMSDFLFQLRIFAGLNPQAKLTIAFALAAPILKLCKARNFTVNLMGRTGSGKSAVQSVAAAIYGNPKHFMTSFNATEMAILGRAQALNDLPAIVDEFQSADIKIRETTDKLLYDIVLGKNRARCDRYGNLRQVGNFGTILIVSAEQSLLQDYAGGGAMNRILELSMPPIPDEVAVYMHRYAEKHYGVVGRKWIEYLEGVAQSEDIPYVKNVTDYEDIMRGSNSIFKDLSAQHLTMLALAWTALKAFDRAFNTDITGEDLQMLEQLTLVAQDIPTAKQVQNSSRAIEVIQDYIQSHPAFFIDLTISGAEIYGSSDSAVIDDSKTFPNMRRDLAGYIFDNGDVLIFKPALNDVLKKFPSPQAIVKQLAVEGKIIFGENNRPDRKFQKAKKINGKTQWGYYFPKLIEVDGSDAE